MSISPYIPEYAASSRPKPPRFPGAATLADGAGAVAWVESHISQAAFACPCTPADAIGEAFQAALRDGRSNLWGEAPRFLMLESGLSAGSAAEGFALAGGRATSFVSGESLAQMKEVMHVIAGKRLPVVFHAAARALASQATSLEPGHDDVMAVSDCGWGVLFARNAQQAADLALIARRAAEYSETPFLTAQDGFLTTHTLENVRLPEPEMMRDYAGAPADRLRSLFNPWRPLMSGATQSRDSYMKGRVAQRFFYDRVKPALASAMQEFLDRTGRLYSLLETRSMDDAEFAFIGMGSMMDTAMAVVDHLRRQGVRAGAIAVTSFRPFPGPELARLLANCRAVTVLERTDQPLAGANPLTAEVKSVLADAVLGNAGEPFEWIPEVHSAVTGLGGRDIRPGDLLAAAENMRRAGTSFFVLGVNHPDALPAAESPSLLPEDAFSVRVYSPGGSRAAKANRKLAENLAGLFNLSVQAYPDLVQERVGLPAGYSLTFASSPIGCRAGVQEADLIIGLRESLEELKTGGILCLNSALERDLLSPEMLRTIARRQLQVWIAGGDRLGTLLRLAPFQRRSGMTVEQMFEALERVAGQAVAETARQGYAQAAAVDLPEVPAGDALRPGIRAGLPLETVPEALTPADFCEHIVEAYEGGRESQLEADAYSARGLVPASTALERSFRNVSLELPRFLPQSCTGCMDCVSICPDTAIWARVVEPAELEVRLKKIERVDLREELHAGFASTQKYDGGLFGLFIDVDKCKGCGECVTACSAAKALEMVPKAALDLGSYDRGMDLFRHLPETPARFLSQKSLGDMMLSSRAHLFTGGGVSCAGCGQSTALRLLLAAGGFVYGPDQIGVVAATGCGACSTYPYNPFGVPWTSSLFENAAADAMGIRLRWDQQGQQQRRLWVVGGDDALGDAGLQSLSRLLASGQDIKVMVLDSHAGEPGHAELSQIAMLHNGVFAAQTTAAHLNHFYRAVMAANEYMGPALIVCFASCINEHEVAPDHAVAQARLAVDSRTFPLLIHDPRNGDTLRGRLSLQGNPSPKQDWYQRPRGKEPVGFITYARTEGRFARHFDAEGQPDEHLKRVERERLESWRRLQELAGLR